MKRKVFYSFYHQADKERAARIQQLPIVDGSSYESEQDWQAIVDHGPAIIESWIDEQLKGKSCTIVLIGSDTAHRKWIKHEIQRSWDYGKGLLGIHIHHLEDNGGRQGLKGQNPFNSFTIRQDGRRLSDVVKTYDPPLTDNQAVLEYIEQNLSHWIEEAVCIRDNYRRLRA